MHVLLLISNKLIYREKVMCKETYAWIKIVDDDESVANKGREEWWAGVHADKQVSDILLERSDIYSPVGSNLSHVGQSSKHRQYSNMNLVWKEFLWLQKRSAELNEPLYEGSATNRMHGEWHNTTEYTWNDKGLAGSVSDGCRSYMTYTVWTSDSDILRSLEADIQNLV